MTPKRVALLAAFAFGLAAPAPLAACLPSSEGAADPRPLVTVDLAAAGDLLIHGPVARAGLRRGRYDFRPLLAPIAPIIRRADVALCHVETPVGAGARSGYPLFNAPGELAAAIHWAGWDACSTASNHSIDRGMWGIRATIHALHEAGVRTTGTARSSAEARRILVVTVRGIRIAFLAYTYGTNGLPLPAPWAVNVLGDRVPRAAQRILAEARRARRLGADLVVVNVHWGLEYVHAPTARQRRLARRVLRPHGVDLILGQHAHVVQPIARVHGRFVVYGEGNLLSAQGPDCCPPASQDGLIALVRVGTARGRARVRRVDYVPTRVLHPGYVVVPVSYRATALARADEGGSELARELRASYRRTVRVVGRTRFTRPVPPLGRARSALASRRAVRLAPDHRAR